MSPLTATREEKQLQGQDLRALCSEGFEIGAHSVSHKSLSKLNNTELSHEVRDCKSALEQVLGRQVLMFCYPNGRYNSSVVRQVKEAGYIGARTTRMLSIQLDFKPFQMPTTVQAYPHSRTAYLRNLGRAKSVLGLVRNVTKLRHSRTWVELGKQLFERVLEDGGIWHLYGHSWEIDELGIWDELHEMLDHVSHQSNVFYLTNGQLVSLFNRGVNSLNASLEQSPRGPRDSRSRDHDCS